ncbi:protein-disulfide reductase DsbD [Lysobacter niastensis]|uniref:Thiol:disulfide interchange protein DsbD n=1 Tax=Lysobacter niastensis TaxID=380629 RepID=A0ABS0B5K1_9GAMM|nr:protein-disulfide reductase DsbD [Lysobacter niastensis]MBF6024159.1 protein-disulfide reductase DsbD [Lysobacter niastensis]
MTDSTLRSLIRFPAVRFVAALFAGLALAGPASAAIDPDDLLPVDEAFALSAQAASPDRIAIQWRIADGYYLYRHRISVQTDAGFAAQPLQLPKGESHEDEFFGRVETYRQSLTAELPGQARAGSVTLKIKYQGCADAGICYPPQTRSVTVALSSAAAAEPLVPFGAQPGSAPSGGGLLGNTPGATDALPLPPEQAFRFEAIAQDGNTLLLRFTPARGYYLYRDKTSLKLDAAAAKSGLSLGAPRWPQGVAHRDEHFGNVVVFFDEVEVPVPLGRTHADATPLRLTATFQGCQNDGICYPPMTRSIDVALPAGSVQAAAPPVAPVAAAEAPLSADDASRSSASVSESAAAPQARSEAAAAAPDSNLAEDSRLAAALSGPNRWWALLSFFGFGLLLAFTPCVLPMIPILSGLIAGHGPGLGARRAFALSFIYVLANALVFTVAGVVAGLVGANLQVAFQTPWVIVAFAALFIALALSSFGLYELQLPAALRNRLGSMSDSQRGGSWMGVAVMGALSALIVGPCVAPPLAAAVLYIGQTQDPAFGGAALFLLAMGMGVPLLAFGVAAGKGLPTSGPWMVAVQRVFGFVFLGLAVWMLSRVLPAPATLALWGVLLLAAAAAVALALKAVRRDGARVLGWTTALLLGLLGTAQLVGAMAGSRDPLQPLAGLSGGVAEARELPFRKIKSVADLDREIAAARAAGKPLLLDFYADWCVSCKEMEKYTFPHPSVQSALSGFVLLKADVTANDDLDQALMKRLGIIGPPATLYYTGGGERRELRLFGFEEADKFVERARRATR